MDNPVAKKAYNSNNGYKTSTISTAMDDSAYVVVGRQNPVEQRINREKYRGKPLMKIHQTAEANVNALRTFTSTTVSGFCFVTSDGQSPTSPNALAISDKDDGYGTSEYESVQSPTSKSQLDEELSTSEPNDNDAMVETASCFGSSCTDEFELQKSKELCKKCPNQDGTILATHHCINCDDDMCSLCLSYHERFFKDHYVISLSIRRIHAGPVETSRETRSQSTTEIANTKDDDTTARKQLATQSLTQKETRTTHLQLSPERREINIKEASDKKNCIIIDMCTLNDGTVVLADSENSCLKQVDVTRYELLSSLATESNPRAIACRKGTDLVLADADHKISFISMSKKTNIASKIKLGPKEDCSSIAVFDGDIYLSLCQKIQCYNSDGCLLRTIVYPKEIKRQLSYTQHICISGDTLYASDPNVQLSAFKLDGSRVSKHDNPLITMPVAVCDDGEAGFVLCCKANNSVVNIGANQQAKYVLAANDGVLDPLSVTVVKVGNKRSLVVGQWNDKKVLVFNLQ